MAIWKATATASIVLLGLFWQSMGLSELRADRQPAIDFCNRCVASLFVTDNMFSVIPQLSDCADAERRADVSSANRNVDCRYRSGLELFGENFCDQVFVRRITEDRFTWLAAIGTFWFRRDGNRASTLIVTKSRDAYGE